MTERYRVVLTEPFLIEGVRLAGAGSLGAAAYPENGITIDELLRNADTAMYGEKSSHQEATRLPQASPAIKHLRA